MSLVAACTNRARLTIAKRNAEPKGAAMRGELVAAGEVAAEMGIGAAHDLRQHARGANPGWGNDRTSPLHGAAEIHAEVRAVLSEVGAARADKSTQRPARRHPCAYRAAVKKTVSELSLFSGRRGATARAEARLRVVW